MVYIAPEWTNEGSLATVVAGTASNLMGPAGPTYSLAFTEADYGMVEVLDHGRVQRDRILPGDAHSAFPVSGLHAKALEGSGYTPPNCMPGSELFENVPAGSPFCAWIEELAARLAVPAR